MRPTTGCISIGTPARSSMNVDRVIEFFDPRPEVRSIWVDVYLVNPNRETQPVYILHRGNLDATNVTEQSWSPLAPLSTERSLTERIQALHATPARPSGLPVAFPTVTDPSYDAITISDEHVTLAGLEYALWKGPRTPHRLVGTDENRNVPYTMWECGGMDAAARILLRLRMTLAPATYEAQIGYQGAFHACGEDVLLDKILCDDLPYYDGDDAFEYRDLLRTFQSGTHLVPRVFEYLIVAPPTEQMEWKAQRLSWVTQPVIHDSRYERNTLWFVADIERAATFSLSGQRCNSFTLSVFKQ